MPWLRFPSPLIEPDVRLPVSASIRSTPEPGLLPSTGIDRLRRCRVDLVPVEDELGYGLGIYRSGTACGPVWGHDGGIPGYATIARNDETGRRGIALGLPTDADADEQISEAADRLIDVATCRALGQEPPPVATTRSTDSPAKTWMRRIDESFRLLAKR